MTVVTSGAMADGGNGDKLLTIISHSTQLSGASPNMKSQSHSSANWLARQTHALAQQLHPASVQALVEGMSSVPFPRCAGRAAPV